MAPSSPFKQPPTTRKKSNFKASDYGTGDDVAPANVTIDYAEVQGDEIEVLKAIYMEDYEEVNVKSAWSKASDRAFRLKLKAFSDDDTSVTLSVKLTATYPKSPPILQLDGLAELHPRTQTRIRRIVERRPVEMLGEVMIHTIGSEIQDALEDAAQARQTGTLPSLEDERAVQETAANAQAKQQEEAATKREQEAQAEEDQALQQMIQEEVDRRELKRIARLELRSPAAEPRETGIGDKVESFDQSFALSPNTNAPTSNTVQILYRAYEDSGSTTSAVKPVGNDDVILALRRYDIRDHGDQRSLKQNLLALEEELEALKAQRQTNLASLYAFKLLVLPVDLSGKHLGWNVSILTDLPNRGTLAEMLDEGQILRIERARKWSLDLLDAIDYLHRHGIVHKSIRAENVLLTRTTANITVPLLSGAAFDHRLRVLQGREMQSSAAKGWVAPECSGDRQDYSRKSDVWDFGVLLLSMLLGVASLTKYRDPKDLLDSHDFSDALQDLLTRLFEIEPRTRPSAFDVMPSEFFRNDVPLYNLNTGMTTARSSRQTLAAGRASPVARRSRHNSSGVSDMTAVSRYINDFTELHRLGKGGFGEVVKARNKIDGGIYAIKKIKQDSRTKLEQVLSEVMLLHRLNHAYVVRYYTAWVEDDQSGSTQMEGSAVTDSEEMTADSISAPAIDFGFSSRGLDFVSSSGFNNVEFGEDDEEEGQAESIEDDSDVEINVGGAASSSPIDSEEEIEDIQSPVLRPTKGRSLSHRSIRSTLYIQMEFCERRTLRDLIMKGLQDKPEESWQYLRQILEGLAHIHSHGIIHRDLKPDNVFIDIAGNPRIGDFGLATTSNYQTVGKTPSGQQTGSEMTRSVGTALYVAPELRSRTQTTYNDKVDMYSLGIIFFEMCYPLPTAMERLKVLQDIRRKDFTLPVVFETGERLQQGDIIRSLISHSPSERPSSVELLRSGELPLQIEDETIRKALQSVSDSKSPYYQKMMSALFSQTPDQQIKDFAWDAKRGQTMVTPEKFRAETLARSVLTSVFRRHGAEEAQRQTLIPRSSFYSSPNVVQLLDATGTLVQLPYDLTLPHARDLARNEPAVAKTYTFAHVFRDAGIGGPPQSYGEVDFDITTADAEDITIHDAEIVKVVDEIVDEIPALSSSPVCFHLNHADLLDVILDYCRIENSQRFAVKECLSKLNIHQWTWPKIRSELRAPPLAVPATSLDDLVKFDFRDSIDKAGRKLQDIFEDSAYQSRSQRPIRHLRDVVDKLQSLDLHRNVYLCPLACHNDKFYTGGVIFQCIHDKKNRSVLAAGGRYDSLIESHRMGGQKGRPIHAVGVNIGWDGLITSTLRHQRNQASNAYLKKSSEEVNQSQWEGKRCEVLIASADPTVLRSSGLRLLANLWAQDISAELATESRSIDDLLGRQRDKSHSFIVVVKHGATNSLKVRNTSTDLETEVSATTLASHLRSEMRERDAQLMKKTRPPPSLLRGTSHPESERRANVQVLMAQHRSKKTNKYHIVEAAQQRWSETVESWKESPILAVETRDDVLDSVKSTRLSESDTWRKVIQSVQLAERSYLTNIHEVLSDMRKGWEDGNAGRVVCLFNFRSGSCIYYDVGI